LGRRQIFAFEEFLREGDDLAFAGLIHRLNSHDPGRESGNMIPDEARKIRFGIAVTHDQYLMGGLQQSSDSGKIGFGIMGMAGTNRTGLMMDIALSTFRLNPVFGNVVFGEIQNEGLGVIYVNDGMEMLRHGYSLGVHPRAQPTPWKSAG
jgi:hypothetical protein